jgi:N-acetylglucosaminyl-diphospho-decaprenol L-rhamnosyltransferase
MSAQRLAVVVIGHNSGDEIVDCIASVVAQGPAQIVVVDNASTDGSDVRLAQRYGDVPLIRNERNTGFAAAANQGVRATDAPFVLLLNPDAVLQPGALDALQAALDAKPRAGAVGALVRNPDGTIQPTRRRFPSIWQSIQHGLLGIFRPDNPGTRAYTLDDALLTELSRVDWVAGPAMAVRREAFEDVGGFDEAFFFFVEDVDLCKRMSTSGWQVWFEPGAEVTHRWGGSWTQRPIRFLWVHQWNLFRYVRKHYRGAWLLLYPFIAAGLLLRFTLLVLRWLITRRSVPSHRSARERKAE